jgi:tRNA pseudouridine38/39 synthase
MLYELARIARAMDGLKRLTRLELKLLAQHLAERCGGGDALAVGVAAVARVQPRAAGEPAGRDAADESPAPAGVSAATSPAPAAAAAASDSSSGVGSSSSSGSTTSTTTTTTTSGAPPPGKASRAGVSKEPWAGRREKSVPGGDEAAAAGSKRKRSCEGSRPFEMGYFAQRHIALHVAYFGERYCGFASQELTEDTVEHHLFAALNKACLISDRADSGYSRCGRTDAGVSAVGQIVTLKVRSQLRRPLPAESSIAATLVRPSKKKAPGGVVGGGAAGAAGEEGAPAGEEAPLASAEQPAGPDSDDALELNYPALLNKLLPEDIMVLGWAPCPSLDFKARFNAESRTYRYYFLRRALDLDAMRRAGALLQGVHDYRNFCKMDVVNVHNYMREIRKVDVVEVDAQLCFLRVEGTAFLWHQIRCVAAVLFMVGRGQERPEVVTQLLDVEAHPRKPVYDIAAPLPLVLHDSDYADLAFRYDARVLASLRERLDAVVAGHELRAGLARGMLEFVVDHAPAVLWSAPGSASLAAPGPASGLRGALAQQGLPLPELAGDFAQSQKGKSNLLGAEAHMPLLLRPLCDSYDTRVENLSDKKRETARKRHGRDL